MAKEYVLSPSDSDKWRPSKNFKWFIKYHNIIYKKNIKIFFKTERNMQSRLSKILREFGVDSLLELGEYYE